MLQPCREPLAEVYDLVMLDLDGVVYVGDEAVPGAAEGIDAARASGSHAAFVTNNASRTPDEVADRLRGLGVVADPDDVVTSAQAAARVLRERLGEGARVHVLGADGLRAAVRAAGLDPDGTTDDSTAVVTGYGPDVVWRQVMQAAVAIRGGLWWVASNTDLTIPTAYGVAPGHGALVGLLRRFSEVEPEVAGKPAPPLLRETIRRVGGSRPLMVGDRLDTDIEGAAAVGVDSLLVLTGVTGLAELCAAPPEARPTYLDLDLGGLVRPQPAVDAGGAGATCGGWRASVSGGLLEVSGEGEPADWWRAVAVASWHHLDTRGEPARHDALLAPGSGPRVGADG